jgi:hypothetical protein
VNSSSTQVALIVRECLDRGGTVEIDGLGSFSPGRDGRLAFIPQTRPRVFLAYVVEDAAAAGRLYEDLAAAGFDPWMDRRKLLPGQNWPRSIEHAIGVSDFFLACLSSGSISKRGRFQAELRYALDCAAHLPLEQVFFIPVRLEDCRVPARISQEYQWVDLFPDWAAGVRRIVRSMRKQASSDASSPRRRICRPDRVPGTSKKPPAPPWGR